MSHVTHLEAAIDGTELEAGTVQTLHAGRPIWVRYDLNSVREHMSKSAVAERAPSMWRYRELLPFRDESNIVSLGETTTPLLECPRLADELGVGRLIIKDESRLPTGSFKARGMAMAVTMMKELGITRAAVPTAGNAGGALAAYCARAGIECTVLMPEDTPIVNRYEAALFGAHTFLVNGLIHECGAIVGEGKEKAGWFDVSTLKEPYRIEGKKTMGLELAEQMHWSLPDHIFYPTGGGTGLIGMWKAFAELDAIGWLDSPKKPAMHACQSDGCSPIATAYANGERFAEVPEKPHTIASGLRVPKAVGDFMILDAVRESGGRAHAVPEADLVPWMRRACELEGISLCPEDGACLGALRASVEDGTVGPSDTVVV
ncbi:MAG: threonine synthase, partial [Planctomycetota bacterium]